LPSVAASVVDEFVTQNEPRLLEELLRFLRIPSISTLPEHAGDVARAAGFVSEALQAAGMEHVEIVRTEKHPLVYADWARADLWKRSARLSEIQNEPLQVIGAQT
jgi:acetylornithine deacetylase/succinyl-diaminopimelate desuccinylase-like protein